MTAFCDRRGIWVSWGTVWGAGVSLILFLGIIPRDADAVQRILLSFYFKDHLGEWVSSGSFLYGWWPPGGFVPHLSAHAIGGLLGLDTLQRVPLISAMSFTAWMSGALGLSFWSAARTKDRWLVAGMLFALIAWFPPIQSEMASSMSQGCAFGFLGMLFGFLRLGIDSGDAGVNRYICISAICAALATATRTELILPAGVVCLYVWRLRGFRTAIWYGAIAGSFFVVRLSYTMIFHAEDLNFLNFTARSTYVERIVFDPETLLRDWWNWSKEYLLAIASIFVGTCLVSWIWHKQSPGFGRIRESLLRVIRDPVFGCGVVLGLFVILLMVTKNAMSLSIYLTLPMVMVCVPILGMVARGLEKLIQPLPWTQVCWTLAVFVVSGVAVLVEIRDAWGTDVLEQELVDWWNDDLRRSDDRPLVMVDCMGWQEQRIYLELASRAETIGSGFISTYFPEQLLISENQIEPNQFPVSPKFVSSGIPFGQYQDMDRERDNILQAARRYLREYRPDYLVCASNEVYASLSGREPLASFYLSSVIRPCLDFERGEVKEEVISGAKLNPVFENARYLVFNVVYSDS